MLTQKHLFSLWVASWAALSAGCDFTAPENNLLIPVDEVVLKGLNQPVTVRFTPDERILVGEKGGLIKLFQHFLDEHPTIVADLSEATHGFWDRGLLSLELDPAYPARPYLYALYTYDAPMGGMAPYYHDSDNRTPTAPAQIGSVSARLSRFTLAENTSSRTLIATQEKILIHDWCQVFPSHGIGTIRFGGDGALYVGAGDGASFEEPDWGQLDQLCGDPQNLGGAMRAQRHGPKATGVTNLNGAVLRVDPDTGLAMRDNPQVTRSPEVAQDPASESRVVAYGLRNPFRFAARPGTHELWIGDVGWYKWEEVNRITDPRTLHNFGWPCYEGTQKTPGYEKVPLCQEIYAANQEVTPPHYTYGHNVPTSASNPCGGSHGSIAGLAFYNGGVFPERYNGALFIADYARNCIWAQLLDENGQIDPNRQEEIITNAKSPVELEIGPGGDIYYPSVGDGTIHRVTFASKAVVDHSDPGNDGPVPVIDAPPQDVSVIPGTTFSFHGSGTDFLDNPLPSSALSWKIVIHHCNEIAVNDCHLHTHSTLEGVEGGSFTMPYDHTAPSFVSIHLNVAYEQDGVRHRNEAVRRMSY